MYKRKSWVGILEPGVKSQEPRSFGKKERLGNIVGGELLCKSYELCEIVFNIDRQIMITYFGSKGKINICEDSLTATVFDLLKYLPSEIFWNILKKSLYYDKLPDFSGDIKEILFWQKWNPTNTTNTRFVEPDVFLRYKHFDIIIEAKRYNEFQQSDNQLTSQIIAYHNEFEEESKDLYFIQLGGLNDKNDIEDKSYSNKSIVICKTDWSKLLNQIVNEKKSIESIELTAVTPYKRILDDLIKGFELHQYFRKTWLDSIQRRKTVTNLNASSLFNYAKRH